MEIVALVVIAGLIGWWMYRNVGVNNSTTIASAPPSQEPIVAEPVKIEQPAESVIKAIPETAPPPAPPKSTARVKKSTVTKKTPAAKPKAKKTAKK